MRNERVQQFSVPVGWIIIGVMAFLAFISSVHGQAVTHIETVGFTVSDMDRSIDFYTHVLPFEMVSDKEASGNEFEHLAGVFGARARIVRLKLGGEQIELTEYLNAQGRAIPADSRSNDRWFQHIAIIVSDMDRAYAMLREHRVRHASTGPQTLPAYITAAAGIKAYYFKDPDGHVLEILQFPDGKGLKKWHDLAATGKLFLGIDHTAIVVGDSETSLGLYRDRLGLTVAGTSDNYGPEQEHLNNVFGARLHITGLRTRDEGVAVEFLEYIAPTDGREIPRDTRSSDLWHWETTFASPDLSAFLLTYRPAFISSGIIDLAAAPLGARRGLMFKDPDGHALRLIEK